VLRTTERIVVGRVGSAGPIGLSGSGAAAEQEVEESDRIADVQDSEPNGIRIESGESTTRGETVLLQREPRWIFGGSVFTWQLSVSTWMSDDNGEVMLSFQILAGSSQGSALRVYPQFDRTSRVLAVRVVEDMFGRSAKTAEFLFRLTDDATFVELFPPRPRG